MNTAPTNTQLQQACIPAFIIAGVLDHAEERGLAAEALIAGLGLTTQQIRHAEILLSFRQATTIIRRLIRALPEEPAGLQIGSRGALGSFGILGLAMLASQSVGEALTIGIAHHRTAGSLMDFSDSQAPDETLIRFEERFPDREILPFLCEEAAASVLALLRLALGPAVSLRRIELNYPEPVYADSYRRLFNCPVLFNRPSACLAMDATLLRAALPTHSLASCTAALSASRQLVGEAAASPDIVASVENLIYRNCRRRLSMASIAESLNITERTLRRSLAAAGHTFSALRDKTLQRRASDLLRQSELSISDIAVEIGFSDLREFRRAFQRWTGMNPSQLRRTLPAPPLNQDMQEYLVSTAGSKAAETA